MKKRLIALIILLIATTASAVCAFAFGIDPPIGNVIGAYGAIGAMAVAGRIFKVSDELYIAGLTFVFFASPVGSVLNLYRSVGPYDKIVHLFSGILLAILAVMILKYLFRRCGLDDETIAALTVPAAVFAFFFAGAGAGIWEIFEFAADKLSGSGMQRGMVDTITDMIAGNIGGLAYAAFMVMRDRRKK